MAGARRAAGAGSAEDAPRGARLRGAHARARGPGHLLSTRAETAGGAPATRRILDATRALVVAGGAAEVSMGDVAAKAGVSKALVLYHFSDKESLLLALVDDIGAAVVQRERQAAAGEPASHALDAYWTFLDRELRGGDLHVLGALSDYNSERVRAASRRIARQRREVAAEHVALIFSRLSLAPRIPPELLAETVVAFLDGLAGAVALEPDRDHRPAFDVLWLALLTLAE